MYILYNFLLFHYFLSVINHVSHSQTCLEDISGSNYISNHSLAPIYPSVAASAISISQPVSLASSPETRGPLVNAVFPSTSGWWPHKAMLSERSLALQMSFLVAKLNVQIKGETTLHILSSTLPKRTLSCVSFISFG